MRENDTGTDYPVLYPKKRPPSQDGERVPTGSKLSACADLIRIDLALGAGFFLVAGQILATGGLPPTGPVLLGFLTLFFISGSANISNDSFDRDVDRINLPSRPLPSGRISVRELWTLFSLFTMDPPQPANITKSFMPLLRVALPMDVRTR